MNTDQNRSDQHADRMTDNDAAAAAAAQHDSDHGGHRPFGFWLKLVDRRISEQMETLFADDGITRRDWRMLNLLAGEARDERLRERLLSKPHALRRLVERGWVAGFPPEITDAGREARDRLETEVTALRERVAGAVSPDEFATTLRSLVAIARELGWDESQPLPRGRRGGRRFGSRTHEHRERAERSGRRHDFGGFDDAAPEHHASRGDFSHRRHGFGPRGARQDLHVHVHLHDRHHGSDGRD
ncbi:MAG: hypothetical protein M3Y46_02600 [Actinomycetota bacterium]|nr:hypothetical protein [Actinomycetota bacterium]